MPQRAPEMVRVQALSALVAPPGGYERGVLLWLNGHVRRLARVGQRLCATVEAECPSVWLRDEVVGSCCSCAVFHAGGFCEHCVALVVAWVAEEAGPSWQADGAITTRLQARSLAVLWTLAPSDYCAAGAVRRLSSSL